MAAETCGKALPLQLQKAIANDGDNVAPIVRSPRWRRASTLLIKLASIVVLSIVLAVSATASAQNGVGEWNYYNENDPMANGLIHYAQVNSSNSFNFSFPYQGKQYATLQIRKHPRFGNDVALYIERGQFICSSFDDCNVLVRFDDGRASNFSAIGPADHSTNVLFLKNYKRFISGVLKAKVVRISAEVFHEGQQVFEFPVAGFSEEAHKN